jgi:hypothetical protein
MWNNGEKTDYASKQAMKESVTILQTKESWFALYGLYKPRIGRKGFCLVNKPMGLPSESFTWQNRALGWLDFCSYGRPGTIPKTILKNNYLIFKPNYFIVLNK